MTQTHTTAAPEAAKGSSFSPILAPTLQRAPAADPGQASLLGRRAANAIGGGSPQAPPASFRPALETMQDSPARQAGLLRQLQRNYGNSYVGQMLQAQGMYTKLEIGGVDDPEE